MLAWGIHWIQPEGEARQEAELTSLQIAIRKDLHLLLSPPHCCFRLHSPNHCLMLVLALTGNLTDWIQLTNLAKNSPVFTRLVFWQLQTEPAHWRVQLAAARIGGEGLGSIQPERTVGIRRHASHPLLLMLSREAGSRQVVYFHSSDFRIWLKLFLLHWEPHITKDRSCSKVLIFPSSEYLLLLRLELLKMCLKLNQNVSSVKSEDKVSCWGVFFCNYEFSNSTLNHI